MRNPFARRESERSDQPAISFDSWVQMLDSFSFQGLNYTSPGSPQESIGTNFAGLARSAYKQNGVVFACMAVRMHVFSDARLTFRRVDGGKPGKPFGDVGLAPLEKPWRAATTRDLMTKTLQYADLAGNAYLTRRPGGPAGTRIVPLRPDWVTIIAGMSDNADIDGDFGVWDIDAEIVGYLYHPGGPGSGKKPVTLLADEVAHFAPNPDPEARFRGMSWITPVLREVMADKAATAHKLAFFENGATVNLAIKLDTTDIEKYKAWIEVFKENHDGAANAYKTLFLAAGADPTVIGANLEQSDFKTVQGAGETRIAAAAEVPPILVGLSEGLEAATYSNYISARRRFADGTMRPLWGNFCGSVAPIIDVPDRAELWYDESGVAFLREDQKDVAQISALQTVAIRQLVDAGFEPDAAVAAIMSADLDQLSGKHTGLYSVQLQPPSDGTNPDGGGDPPAGVPAPAKAAPKGGQGGAAAAALDEITAILEIGKPGSDIDSPD